MPESLMTIADVAKEVGLTEASARVYHKRAAKNRRDGSPRPRDMPAPDYLTGSTPGWTPETIAAWKALREGSEA